MVTPDEIQNHLIALNWAYFEQEQYRVDAYDQRNGQRWFLEAVGRVNEEMMWFSRSQVMLGVSLEDPAHRFCLTSGERETLLRTMLRAEYVFRQLDATGWAVIHADMLQELRMVLQLSGNLPLQESPLWY